MCRGDAFCGEDLQLFCHRGASRDQERQRLCEGSWAAPDAGGHHVVLPPQASQGGPAEITVLVVR